MTSRIAIADGGDCVSDLGVLRGQQALFGSDRLPDHHPPRDPARSISQSLEALRGARAKARERAWEAGARPSELILDIDATLLGAHSEKERAAGNYKGGFGFFPLLCYLDRERRGTGRPSCVPETPAPTPPPITPRCCSWPLSRLPAQDLDREILVRTDSAGGTHAFTSDCRDADIRFSVGYEVDARVREAILSLPDSAWQQAIEADGTQREGAWVAELGDRVDLSSWPEGTRLIVRRERPHPGAQFCVFDAEGYRHVAFLTDQKGDDIAALELPPPPQGSGRGSRSAAPRTPGCANLPFAEFAPNQVWLELCLLAHELLSLDPLPVLGGRAQPG